MIGPMKSPNIPNVVNPPKTPRSVANEERLIFFAINFGFRMFSIDPITIKQ